MSPGLKQTQEACGSQRFGWVIHFYLVRASSWVRYGSGVCGWRGRRFFIGPWAPHSEPIYVGFSEGSYRMKREPIGLESECAAFSPVRSG